MSVFFEALVAHPVLPATILLVCLILWGLTTIVVGLDIDLNSHVGGWFDSLEHLVWEGLASFAVVPMRWLNMRDVPIIIWLSIWSLMWWTVSIGLWMSFDRNFWPNPSWWLSSLLIVRNLAITLPFTKLGTQPMRGLINTAPLQSKSLIGSEAEISSYEATPESGQAKFKTDASPLLLNVRTDGPHLTKGTRVWITHYDAGRRIYYVSATTTFKSHTE